MSTWVIRCKDSEGTTYAYAFSLAQGETPRQTGADIAEEMEMDFIEVMTVDDFLCGNSYELCTP